MPKYLLLKHYTGGPTQLPSHAPMQEWTPEEITAHIDFQRYVARLLSGPLGDLFRNLRRMPAFQ